MFRLIKLWSYRFNIVRWDRQKQSSRGVLQKKGVLRNFGKFTGKHLYQRLFYNEETLAQVFSCEICEISKNTFFCRTPQDNCFWTGQVMLSPNGLLMLYQITRVICFYLGYFKTWCALQICTFFKVYQLVNHVLKKPFLSLRIQWRLSTILKTSKCMK